MYDALVNHLEFPESKPIQLNRPATQQIVRLELTVPMEPSTRPYEQAVRRLLRISA
jgi:hypothetical protein